MWGPSRLGDGWFPHPGPQGTPTWARLCHLSHPSQDSRACLAEQLQVGDWDFALLVASLPNEPVGVHAGQAIDGEELRRTEGV